MELSKHRKIFYDVTLPRFTEPRGGSNDHGRTSLLPMPETVVGYVAAPHSFAAAYYAFEDEVLADNETTDLDRYAHQQWLLDRIDNPELPENDDWEPSLNDSDED